MLAKLAASFHGWLWSVREQQVELPSIGRRIASFHRTRIAKLSVAPKLSFKLQFP